jgi:hypothetical protein
MTDWSEGEHDELALEPRWPMAPAHLLPLERWLWWEQLWSDAIMLGERYRVRALGLVGGRHPGRGARRLAAWVARYDAGEWDDPPGKLALLYTSSASAS